MFFPNFDLYFFSFSKNTTAQAYKTQKNSVSFHSNRLFFLYSKMENTFLMLYTFLWLIKMSKMPFYKAPYQGKAQSFEQIFAVYLPNDSSLPAL